LLKKTYSCDICRDPKPTGELVGCKFSNLHDFTFSNPHETEGVHICHSCLKIIKCEMPKLGKEYQ
jgi:hypothetical protein